LPADVVLVDEASMVDVALLRRLTDALEPHARLILIGDRDQLASVESGAVLAELTGERAEAAGCVARLRRSYRFDPSRGIGALARCVRTGDVSGALSVLAEGREVSILTRPTHTGLGPLETVAMDGWAAACAAHEPRAALEALGQFRVLCAHRTGPWGVSTMNARLEGALAAQGRIRPAGGLYSGQPIMITRNDYDVRLFNGEMGVVLDGERGPRVWFTGNDGPRSVAGARLPRWRSAWAVSVHKSQGSEFDRVAVVLPEVGSPLLTREMLYTAVTRARHEVAIVGDPDAVAEAIRSPTERASGLGDAAFL